MTGRYHDNVDIDPDYPRGLGICDRCGTPVNHYKLRFEYQWAGTTLRSTGFMVCPPCYNPPAPFLQTLVLPPDPPPLVNARPQNDTNANTDFIATELLMPIDDEMGDALVRETVPPVYPSIDLGTEDGSNIDAESGLNIILEQR